MELTVWQVPSKPTANFLENIRVLNSFHRIHSPMPAVESCITPLEKATAYLEMAVQGAKINYGEKNTVKGLHGVPS